MLPIPNLRRETRPTDLRKTTHDALKAALLAPALYLKEHPDITTHFALPFAGATLSGPLLSLLPLGPLGPSLGILAASFARFKLRQNAAGSYYALLHSAGLAGVSGQVLSLMSFMSLGAVFGRYCSLLLLLLLHGVLTKSAYRLQRCRSTILVHLPRPIHRWSPSSHRWSCTLPSHQLHWLLRYPA